MEPAIQVLHNALQGDEGARSFLDRTSSIYVLDARSNEGSMPSSSSHSNLHSSLNSNSATTTATSTSTSTSTLSSPPTPHTYGCWNFIHQAMNEVERHNYDASLIPSAQLLATMALRVARRSNRRDQQLVTTCLQNAQYLIDVQQQKQLLSINAEIRDIVMGRLAALALDHSANLNQKHQHPSVPLSTSTSTSTSASPSPFFTLGQTVVTDPVVLDTICAALAANAVSNGIGTMTQLMEWMLSEHPWNRNTNHSTATPTATATATAFPPFCAASLTMHLAKEAARPLAPKGSRQTLQRASMKIIYKLLGPLLQLSASVQDSEGGTAVGSVDSNLQNQSNPRIVAMILNAITQWCAITELSIAQIKHICAKVKINIVEILSDIMYSNERSVIDALAGFLDEVLSTEENHNRDSHTHHHHHHHPTRKIMTHARRDQVRWLMEVPNVESFSVTNEKLEAIETKEMMIILEDLTSAIGLQRFRFLKRQANGDLEVCRNLTRMAVVILRSCRVFSIPSQFKKWDIPPGLLELLVKAAAHPSIDICTLALQAIIPSLSALPQQSHSNGLVHQVLPILQGKAITPHTQHLPPDYVSSILLDTEGGGNGDYATFAEFRNNTLTEALIASWKAEPEIYLNSCVAAIDEFCRNEKSESFSFHLEAVLFCLTPMASDIMSNEFEILASSYLPRVTMALSSRPAALISNPWTLAQACRFVEKYSPWFTASTKEGVLDVATSLALSTLQLCSTSLPYQEMWREMKHESDTTPFSAAVLALKELLSRTPEKFCSPDAMSILGAGWESTFVAANRGTEILTVQNRVTFCEGLCNVVAALEPQHQRGKSLWALAMPSLDCLQTMLHLAKNETGVKQRRVILERASAEMTIVATMVKSFSQALAEQKSGSESSQNPSYEVLKRAWQSIVSAASEFHNEKSVQDGLDSIFCACLQSQTTNETYNLLVLDRLFSLAQSILEYCELSEEQADSLSIRPVITFLSAFVEKYGNDVDFSSKSFNRSDVDEETTKKLHQLNQTVSLLVQRLVDKCHDFLGSAWNGANASQRQQGNGQSAFEATHDKDTSMANSDSSIIALTPVLNLLRIMMLRCPYLMIDLPLNQENDDQHSERMITRSIKSAVSTMISFENIDSYASCEFLIALFQQALSHDTELAGRLRRFIDPWEEQILKQLLSGICGEISTAQQLLPTATLLFIVLQSGCRNNPEKCRHFLFMSLSGEGSNFRLGEAALRISVNVFVSCGQGQISNNDFLEFVEDIWQLHLSQLDDEIDLAMSDNVYHFCNTYQQT